MPSSPVSSKMLPAMAVAAPTYWVTLPTSNAPPQAFRQVNTYTKPEISATMPVPSAE